MIFYISSVFEKLNAFEASLKEAMALKKAVAIGGVLGRDVQVVKTSELPPKPKLSSREGQARLLHDLASIELQAMELALRGLYEYPEAPALFREELSELARSEARHLRLCLDHLKRLSFEWGHWPIHTALWQTVSTEDTLLERVFIVHRYLEASGLDAGDSILKRLSGIAQKECLSTVALIVSEEVGHVEFGSKWFREICREQGRDAEQEFARLFAKISKKAPRKERTSVELRLRAGFSEGEISCLKAFTGP